MVHGPSCMRDARPRLQSFPACPTRGCRLDRTPHGTTTPRKLTVSKGPCASHRPVLLHVSIVVRRSTQHRLGLQPELPCAPTSPLSNFQIQTPSNNARRTHPRFTASGPLAAPTHTVVRHPLDLVTWHHLCRTPTSCLGRKTAAPALVPRTSTHMRSTAPSHVVFGVCMLPVLVTCARCRLAPTLRLLEGAVEAQHSIVFVIGRRPRPHLATPRGYRPLPAFTSQWQACFVAPNLCVFSTTSPLLHVDVCSRRVQRPGGSSPAAGLYLGRPRRNNTPTFSHPAPPSLFC
jgi:hypothetical protein